MTHTTSRLQVVMRLFEEANAIAEQRAPLISCKYIAKYGSERYANTLALLRRFDRQEVVVLDKLVAAIEACKAEEPDDNLLALLELVCHYVEQRCSAEHIRLTAENRRLKN